MPVGTGLGGQLGCAVESTYGTYVVPDRFYEILDESLERKQVILQPSGIRAGTPNLRRGSKRQLVTNEGGGDVNFEVGSVGFGRLFKMMLGSSASTITQMSGASLAYRQIHTLGDNTGLMMTIQKGVPQTDGTSKPFTFLGSKLTDWEVSISTSAYAKLKLGVDAKQVVTSQSLAVASYPSNLHNLAFAGATLSVTNLAAPSAGLTVTPQGTPGAVQYNYKITTINAQGESTVSASVNTTTGNATLNGTNFNRVTWTAVSGASGYNVYGRPATSGGIYKFLGTTATTQYDDQNMVAGTVDPPSVNTAGVPIASVNDCTISGTMPMKTDRYYLGATGLKAEPVMNDYPTVSGKLNADFVAQADFYDRFAADSAAALQLTFLGQSIQAPWVETLAITVPEVRFTGDTPKLGGLDIVQLDANFEAAYDGTNPGVQFTYISPDSLI
jgi:hypothetical protein